jgi:hypothetical protein
VTDLNPQAKQMADESTVRGLDAQARATWPQEVHLIRRYGLPGDAHILDAGCGTGTSVSASCYRKWICLVSGSRSTPYHKFSTG